MILVQPGDIPATLTLARYLRDYLELTGTKVSCNQSGCGACTVTAEIPDPSDPNTLRTKSVNSVSIRNILGIYSLSVLFQFNCKEYVYKILLSLVRDSSFDM